MLDIFVKSETKLGSNIHYRINIPGYCFVRQDSPTNTGGLGLYIKHDLHHTVENAITLSGVHAEGTSWSLKMKKKTNDTYDNFFNKPNY